MLALRPPPPPRIHNDMYCRGRSRQVSRAALARQLSEERRPPCRYPRPMPPSASGDSSHPSLVSLPPPPQQQPLPATTLSPTDDHGLATTRNQSQCPLTTPASDFIPVAAPLPTLPISPAFIRPSSPSPPTSASLTPDDCDSPPSPPPSLQDQVHIAYALEDIHLAKVLLLRLKGIEVTGDDDPRIAEVQDEDFDFCFIPHGKLMDEREEKMILERQREERERLEEKRRIEKLRECGRMWEEQKRRLREERMIVLRRREQERIEEEKKILRRRAIEEEQRAAFEAERVRYRALHARRVVNYAYLDSPRGDNHYPLKQALQHTMHPDTTSTMRDPKSALHQDPFTYDSMPTTCSSTRVHKPVLPQELVTSPISQPRPIFPPSSLFDDSREVSFTDVLHSMEGPLFPLDAEEERAARSTTPLPRSKSKSRSLARKRREAELLRALLVHVERTSEERRLLKGKQRAQPRTSETCAACTADSLRSPSTPISPALSNSSSSLSPRPGSWLSFRSSISHSPASTSSSSFMSASSVSTHVTTPSTSPRSPSSLSSWFKPNPISSSRRPKSSISAPSLTIPADNELRHSCRSRSRLLPVPASESPLPLDELIPKQCTKSVSPFAHSGATRPAQQRRSASSAKESAGLLVRRMSRFIELAKGFQNAYMNTALFSISASYDNYEDREINYHVIGSIVDVRVQGTMASSAFDTATGAHAKRPMRLRPAGYRASACDVTQFLRPEVICPATTSSCSSNSASSSSSSVYTDPDSETECTHTIPELDHTDTSGSATVSIQEAEVKYIPLISPYPPAQPPRTVLPQPLPYKLVFKPIPPAARSPFRFNVFPLSAYTGNMYSRCHSHNPAPSAHKHHGGHGGEQITWRVRSIANPMYLRLKAAQNCVCGRGEPVDSVGKDFGLGSGKERMVGVAFEGVGKSWLGAA